ncbi:MAG TPA: hypothetical protein DCQ32_01750 [Cyanobacteria bacterium UBA8156]|nr:hypothetical protein [Cyanobacteria bacterium UBA8156]
MAKLSADLQELTVGEDPGQVLPTAGDRAFGLLFVLLSLPSALPIPASGYSTPFGVVVLILALQWLVGRPSPWLPLAVPDRPDGFGGGVAGGLTLVVSSGKADPTAVGRSVSVRADSGAVALMAIAMILPIPGTNTVPAMGILSRALACSKTMARLYWRDLGCRGRFWGLWSW